MSGLRCTGVLYQGGVSGSSLRTVWCKAAHFGAWPRASVGLGNASFPATPSAPHPHPARHGHAAPRGNGHRAPAGSGTGHPSPRRGDGTATQPSWGTWELNARAGGSAGDAEPGVWFIEGTHPQVTLERTDVGVLEVATTRSYHEMLEMVLSPPPAPDAFCHPLGLLCVTPQGLGWVPASQTSTRALWERPHLLVARMDPAGRRAARTGASR